MSRTGSFLSQHATLVAIALLLSPAAFAQTDSNAGSASAQPVTEGPARHAAAVTGPQPTYSASPSTEAERVPQRDLTQEPPPTDSDQVDLQSFSFVPRLGLQGGGMITSEYKCESSACAQIGAVNSSLQMDLGSAFAFGADFMFRVGDLFRIGPGLLHTLTSEVELQNLYQDAGSLTEINFVAEVIPRVSPTIWLVPRAQVGIALFNASGPLKTDINTAKAICAADESDAPAYPGVKVECSNFDNPHLGFDLGVGFGAMFALSPTVRVRADAMYEYFRFSLGKEKISGTGVDFQQSTSLSGNRYLLLAGLEI